MRTGFWSRFSIIFQILLSVCTVFAGSVTFAYFLMRHDYEASAWGLFAAFFALVVTHLHVLFLRNDLDDWYDPNSFDPMKYMSIVFLISGLITTGANLFLAVQKRESKLFFSQAINF